MTVAELIEALSEAPGDSLVVLSSDAEGNDYRPLAYADLARYAPVETWYGDVLDEDADEEDYDGVVDAFVLWPL